MTKALKPGYKQTEVGVIPEEWGVGQLSESVASGPKNGYSGRSGKDTKGTLTLTLTATSSGGIILNDQTVKRLEETLPPHSEIFLKPGDVLVQRSNTPDLVGTAAIFTGPDNLYAYPDLMMRLRFKLPETAQWFWRFANSVNGRRYFVRVAAGSTGTMPKISGDKLRNMSLPLPPLPEQRAIAGALSDVDALLGSLDRLIAKKRDLKQAAMQELLTGHIRLPGFQVEWQTRPIGSEVADLPSGVSVNSVEVDHFSSSSELGILKTSAVKDGVFLPFECKKIAPRDIHRVKLNPRAASILISRMNTIDLVGECGYVGADYPQLFVPDRLWLTRFRPDSRVSAKWLSFVLSSPEYRRQLRCIAGGTSGSMKNISKGMFLALLIRFPTPEEQTAIAGVLSDMDAEIAALEQRREKTRGIKQGMMQELLTGRIRLV
jgi:restriction endonuclease S subunit